MEQASSQPVTLSSALGVVISALSEHEYGHALIVFTMDGAAQVRLQGRRKRKLAVFVVSHCVSIERVMIMIKEDLKLSPMQARVAYLVALGLTKSRIASQLGVRPNTVKSHAEAVYARLRCRTRKAVERKLARCIAQKM